MNFIDIKNEYEFLKEKVEQETEKDESLIPLSNSMLSDSLKNQIELQLRWERIYSKINWISKESETLFETYFSESYYKVMTEDNRKWSTTDAKLIAARDVDYINAKKLYNKIEALKREVLGILNVLESRKYILKDFSNQIINGSEKYIL